MAITKNSQIDLNGNEMILDADGDTTITADTDDRIDFKIAGTDTLHIDATGLGIGTTSPDGKLDVRGTIFVNGDGTGGRIFASSGNLSLSDGNGRQILRIDDPGSGNSHSHIFDSNGRLGVGTSSPSAEFHVKKNDAGFEVDIDSQVTDGVRLLAYDRDASTDRPMQYRASQQIFYIGSSEAMRIDSSGILLIGLTATQNAGTLSGRDNDALQVKGVEGINSKATTNGGGCFIALGDSGNTSGSYFIAVDTGGSVDFRVSSSGALSKASGSFKIKHPLESKKDTHNLVHSFIEGPQADLIYRGVAVLENGTASINLDTAAGMTEGTFVLLNTNTSCFTSNESDWDAVKGSVSGNTLTISCQNTSSTATVSWLVIGERHDQHMIDTEWTDENGKVIVEPLKEQPY